MCRDREWGKCGFADVVVRGLSNSSDPIKLKVVGVGCSNNLFVTLSSTTPPTRNVSDQ